MGRLSRLASPLWRDTFELAQLWRGKTSVLLRQLARTCECTPFGTARERIGPVAGRRLCSGVWSPSVGVVSAAGGDGHRALCPGEKQAKGALCPTSQKALCLDRSASEKRLAMNESKCPYRIRTCGLAPRKRIEHVDAPWPRLRHHVRPTHDAATGASTHPATTPTRCFASPYTLVSSPRPPACARALSNVIRLPARAAQPGCDRPLAVC